MYENTDTITDKPRRLEWLGYLIRTEKQEHSEDAKLDEKRKVGRQKLRWLDDVQMNLKITEIKGWGRKTQDRSECMKVIREAEVKLRGL